MEDLLIDSKGSKLFFSNNNNFSKYKNIQRYNNSGNIVWAFDDLYPQAGIILQDLRQNYKVKATKNSVETLKRIVKTPELIEDHTFLDQFTFKASPYAHQIGATLRMLYYDRLAILFEQGLGKTFIALVHLYLRQKILGHKIKMLVLAPKIVAPNWIREAAKYTDLKGILLAGSEAKRKAVRSQIENETDWDFIVTTYDVVGTNQSSMKAGRTSKTAKLDFWEQAAPRARSLYVQRFVRSRTLTPEEAAYLVSYSGTLKKHRDELWQVLKKVQRHIKGLEVMKCQKEYSDLEFLKGLPYEIICFDEASRIKSWSAARTQASVTLASKCRYRYHLSGTLCNGNPLDFYAPFTILDQTLWASEYAYKQRYFTYSPYNKHIVTGYKHLDELKSLTDPFKYAMLRDQCISLPERIIQKVHTPIPEESIPIYNALVENSSITLGNFTVRCGEPMVKLAKMSQVMSGFIFPSNNLELEAKWCNGCSNLLTCVEKDIRLTSPECIRKDEHLLTDLGLEPIPLSTHKLEQLEEDLDASEEKTIIWAWYKYDLKVIAELLDRKKIRYVTANTKNCDELYKDPGIRVFLGQTSQGIGITLNSATRMIYYSHGFPLESRLQSMDRNYRIGQKHKVLVLDYLDENSLENNVLFLLDHKIDVKTFLQGKLECFSCPEMESCLASETEAQECPLAKTAASIGKRHAVKIGKYRG